MRRRLETDKILAAPAICPPELVQHQEVDEMYEDHWRWRNTNALVVPDMAVARGELLRRGASISETHDLGGFAVAYFSDPDGN